MKKWLRRVFWVAIVAIVLVVAFYWELVSYGLGQARGQYQILRDARPVAEVLADATTPDSVREALEFVQAVRQFAMDSLQLAPSDNYTTFYDQKGRDLMFVVTAAQPYQMEPKEWHFPIIGSFPYKGYFDSTKAAREAAVWEEQGYDVRVRIAGGWSTLGYFTDPILSKMLWRTRGQLAEVIIHELTHATLFVKDSVEFNENLATFIGEQGAEQFLPYYYPDDSSHLLAYRARKKNGSIFANHILSGAQALDSLYQTFGEEADTAWMEQQKQQLISSIVHAVDTLPFDPAYRGYRRLFEQELPNNAYFLSFLRYRNQQSDLESWFEERYQGDLMRLLADLRKKYSTL